MGSKNKKNRNRKKSAHSNDNHAVRSAQTDMSKYAGAVSNKSKRNYSDLKLVRPDNLTEYASRGAKRQSPSYDDRLFISDGSEAMQQAPKRKPKANGTSAKKPTSDKGENVRNRPKNSSSANKRKKPHPSTTKPVETKVQSVEYAQDEYSKALNNSDFYSSVVEKYYMKHPEESKKRSKSSVVRKKKKPVDYSANNSTSNAKKASSGKSVAEMAVKGRTSSTKKDRAQIMKNGKAKGVVPSRAVHRRVRQRNRRRTVFFNSIIVLATIVFLVAVYVTVFFNVKKIEVQGENPYNDQKIIDICKFNKGDNILFVDADGSETQIIEQLPYIESCEINRKLPATIVVNVTQAEALGVAEISSNLWAVLSTKGKVLEMVTNVTVVSSSDVIKSVIYDPEVVSIKDIALKKKLPVLQGIDINEETIGGYIKGEAAQYLDEFEKIHTKASALGLNLTGLKYGDRGYEIEYDGRVNIVLGEVADADIISNYLEKANYILRISGDVTEHEHGEITYLKNKTFFTPLYEQAEPEDADNSKSQGNAVSSQNAVNSEA